MQWFARTSKAPVWCLLPRSCPSDNKAYSVMFSLLRGPDPSKDVADFGCVSHCPWLYALVVAVRLEKNSGRIVQWGRKETLVLSGSEFVACCWANSLLKMNSILPHNFHPEKRHRLNRVRTFITHRNSEHPRRRVKIINSSAQPPQYVLSVWALRYQRSQNLASVENGKAPFQMSSKPNLRRSLSINRWILKKKNKKTAACKTALLAHYPVNPASAPPL